MGTTSEKLTYLNLTKAKIKEAINITGANITNETFRAYETKLKNSLVDIWTNGADVIWNNWSSKITGTGEAITLNNTIQAKMKLDLLGNTSQSGTPTPTSPISINNVTGDNVISVVGKNLFDKSKTPIYSTYSSAFSESETGIKMTPTTSASNSFSLYELGDIKNFLGKTLTFSTTSSPSNLIRYCAFVACDDNGNNRLAIGETLGNNSNTLTTTIGTSYTQTKLTLRIYFADNLTIGTTYSVDNIMVNNGRTSQPYEQYIGTNYSINLGSTELCKIGDYEDRIFKNEIDDSDYSSERDLDSWYIKKSIGKWEDNIAQINIIEGSSGSASTSSTGTIALQLSSNNILNVSNNDMYSLMFKYKYSSLIISNASATNNLSNNTFCLRQGTNDRIYFKSDDLINKTITEIKEILNGLNLYYVLTTPTYTKITDTTLINQLNALEKAMSYDTETNITQTNADKPFIINASAMM